MDIKVCGYDISTLDTIILHPSGLKRDSVIMVIFQVWSHGLIY